MAYLVCHMQKLGSGALGGIQSHNNRERESRTNPDIDREKSQDNYSLVECSNYRKAVTANINDLNLKKAVRKDAVLACSFVVTSSQDFFAGKSPEETKAFFADSVRFFQDRYGEKNVISATVHMDETTPHMHLILTPIHDGKLSAKTMFDRKELQSLQTDIHASVGRSRGLERGKEGSDRAHLSENRFKAEKALEAAHAAEEKLADLTPKILTAEEVAQIPGKKSLFGNKLVLEKGSHTAFLSLQHTAAHAEKMEQWATAATKERDLARQSEANMKNEVITEYGKIQQEQKKLAQEREAVEKAKSQTPSALAQKTITELRDENRTLKSAVESVRSFFKFNKSAIKSALRDSETVERFEGLLQKLGLSQGKSQGRGMER